jgi:hypothetical protein
VTVSGALQNRRGEIEQRKYEADDECTEEKVAEEDDSLGSYTFIFLTTNPHE